MGVEDEFALEDAIEAGDVAAAAALLDSGVDPNGSLHAIPDLRFVDVVLRTRNAAMIRLFHERGADVTTHLGYETNYGNEDPTIVQLLLELGSDPNAIDDDGWAPLHWAAVRGYEDKARVLLSAGSDPTMRTRHGLLPIELAERNNHLNMVTLLTGPSTGSED